MKWAEGAAIPIHTGIPAVGARSGAANPVYLSRVLEIGNNNCGCARHFEKPRLAECPFQAIPMPL
jgi:hypothetical protein